MTLVEGEIYSVLTKKNVWVPAKYCGIEYNAYDRHNKPLPPHPWFLGAVSQHSVDMPKLDESRIRELSPEVKKRFHELEAELRRLVDDECEHIKRSLAEHDRIRMELETLGTPAELEHKTKRRRTMKDTIMNYAKFPYEPNMTLTDGKIGVDQDDASVKMRLADALRERKEATTPEDYAFADRKFIESAHHALWALAEMEKGRPIEQLTYGTYIREAGIWQPTEAA